ncbi:MAG: hypothetical protein K2X39_02220 [Silvanigrellaceae bacterium]|nr:hypothetical protein [Silvanigrellaceae bacterium]
MREIAPRVKKAMVKVNELRRRKELAKGIQVDLLEKVETLKNEIDLIALNNMSLRRDMKTLRHEIQVQKCTIMRQQQDMQQLTTRMAALDSRLEFLEQAVHLLNKKQINK